MARGKSSCNNFALIDFLFSLWQITKIKNYPCTLKQYWLDTPALLGRTLDIVFAIEIQNYLFMKIVVVFYYTILHRAVTTGSKWTSPSVLEGIGFKPMVTVVVASPPNPELVNFFNTNLYCNYTIILSIWKIAKLDPIVCRVNEISFLSAW